MKTRYLLPLAVLAALAASGCDDTYNGNGDPVTLSGKALQEIAQNTGEDTFPIEINDLPLSDADTRDTTRAKPVN